jgi:hypothetical protein
MNPQDSFPATLSGPKSLAFGQNLLQARQRTNGYASSPGTNFDSKARQFRPGKEAGNES